MATKFEQHTVRYDIDILQKLWNPIQDIPKYINSSRSGCRKVFLIQKFFNNVEIRIQNSGIKNTIHCLKLL